MVLELRTLCFVENSVLYMLLTTLVVFLFCFFVSSYYVSLRSELRGVMSVMIFAWKRWSAGLYLQFLRGLNSYWRYLCLFAHSAVQDILCCVFGLFLFVYVASFSRLFICISSSVFSNVYWFVLSRTLVYICCWELCFLCVAYITLVYL
jgi:hypothetical protein